MFYAQLISFSAFEYKNEYKHLYKTDADTITVMPAPLFQLNIKLFIWPSYGLHLYLYIRSHKSRSSLRSDHIGRNDGIHMN